MPQRKQNPSASKKLKQQQWTYNPRSYDEIFAANLGATTENIFRSYFLSSIATDGNVPPQIQQQLIGYTPDTNPPRKTSYALYNLHQMLDKTPSTHSGAALIGETVSRAIEYIPTKNSYSYNVARLLNSVTNMKNANEFYSFDLETLSGKKFGASKFDFITEVSFQHYKGSPSTIDFRAPDGGSLNAVLGLSSEDIKHVNDVISDFMQGKKALRDLSEQERVYVNELLKYSTAEIVDGQELNGTMLRRVKSKMSQDEADAIIKSGNLEKIKSAVRRGEALLANEYDAKRSTEIMNEVYRITQRINNESNVMGIAANAIFFDNAVLRSKSNPEANYYVNPDKIFDVTAIAQWGQNNIGVYAKGGRQLSTIFSKTGLSMDSTTAHIAANDTIMGAGVGFHIASGGTGVNDELKYIQDTIGQYGPMIRSPFVIGGVYQVSGESILSNNNGWIYNPITKEYVGDDGTYFREGVTVDGPESRSWLFNSTANPKETSGYPISLQKDQIYVLVDHQEIDTSILDEDFMTSMVERSGDQYAGVQKLHKVTFAPADQKGGGTASGQRTFIWTDEMLNSKIGALTHVGFADYNPDTNSIKLRGVSNEVVRQSRVARNKNLQESAYRSVSNNPRNLYRMFNDVAGQDTMALADALAHNNLKEVKLLEKQLIQSVSAGYQKHPEHLTHLSTLVENGLLGWLPVFEGVNEQLTAMGIKPDDIDTRSATLFNVIEYLNNMAHDAINGGGIALSESKKFGTDRKINGIRLELPSVLPSNASSYSYTINFNKENVQYGLSESLLRLKGINTDKLTAKEKALAHKNVLSQFVSDAQKDVTHGKDVKKVFKKAGIGSKKFFDKMVKDINANGADYDQIIESANRAIYNALYGSDIRSYSAMPTKFFNLSAAMRSGGAMFDRLPFQTLDQLKRIAKTLTPQFAVTTHKEINDTSVDVMVNSALDYLIDPAIRTQDKYREYLKRFNFADDVIDARMSIYSKSVSELSDTLKDILWGYSKQGISFRTGSGGLYFSAPGRQETLLKLPSLFASEGGVVGIQYGKKRVALTGNLGVDKKGIVHLSTNMHGWMSSEKFIENAVINGENLADTIKRQLKTMYREVGESADAFADTTASAHNSGGTIGVKNLAAHLFGYKKDGETIAGLDSRLLSHFEKNYPNEYEELKQAFLEASQKVNLEQADSISNMGQKYYVLFHKHRDKIIESMARASITTPELSSIYKVFAATPTEQNFKSDTIRLGGNISSGSRGIAGQENRPTAEQTSKAQFMLVDDLERYGLSAGNITETPSSRALNKVRRIIDNRDPSNIKSIDAVNSVNVKALQIDSTKWTEIVDQYMTDERRKALDAVHGDGASDYLYRVLINASTDNDGSILMADTAMALAGDNKNNFIIRDVFSIEELQISRPSRKRKKGEKLKAIDVIPDFIIDNNGSVTVRYSSKVFASQGDSLKYHIKTVDLIEEKKEKAIKRNTYFRGVLSDEKGIIYNEKNATTLVNKYLTNDDLSRLKMISDKRERVKFVSDRLKNYGLAFDVVGESASLSNKVGSGAEKSKATALVTTPFFSSKTKDVAEKLKRISPREYQMLASESVTDAAIDSIQALSSSEKDLIKSIIREPTKLAKEIIVEAGYSRDVEYVMNQGWKGHKNASSALDHSLRNIYENMSDDEFSAFVSTLGKGGLTVSYKSRPDGKFGEIDIIGDDGEFDIDAVTKKLDELVADGKINKEEYYINLQNLGDWEGKKYAGAHTYGKIHRILEDVDNQTISIKQAHDRLSTIAQNVEKFGNDVNSSVIEIDTLNRQTWNDITSYKLFQQLNSKDASDYYLNWRRQSLLKRGIVSGKESAYVLDDGHRGKSILAKTVSDMESAAKYGTGALTMGQYLKDPSYRKWLDDYDVRLIDKYKDDADARKYTLEHLRYKDLTTSYDREILALNGVPGHGVINQEQILSNSDYSAALSKYNKVDINNLEVRANGVADMDIMKQKNNPYTRDTIIDLGSEFGNSRYVAVKGMPAQYYDGDNALLSEYQHSIESMHENYMTYDAYKRGNLDTHTLENIYTNAGSRDDTTVLNYLKNRVLTSRDKIILNQAEAIRGKKGFASKLLSPGAAQIGATLKSQTISDKVSNGLMYDGMSILEHRQHGREIAHGTIGRESFVQAGFYDDAVIDKQLDSFKSRHQDIYDEMNIRLNGDRMAMADELYSKHGVTVISTKEPVIGQRRTSLAQLYMDDAITDGTQHLSRSLKAGQKNDDDGDNPKFYLMDQLDADEASDAMLVQSTYDYKKIIREDISPRTDVNVVFSDVKMFGSLYSNLEDHAQIQDAVNTINNSAYTNEFWSHYDKAIVSGQTLSEQSDNFLNQITDYYNNSSDEFKKANPTFVDEMKNMFVARQRLNRVELANISAGSKAQVGLLNNSMTDLFDMLSAISAKASRGVDIDSSELLSHQTIEAFSNYIKEWTIENTINTKNLGTSSSAEMAVSAIESAGIVLRNPNYDTRQKAAHGLMNIFDTALSEKIDNWITDNTHNTDGIFDADTPVSQWFMQHGADMNDPANMRKILLQGVEDELLSVDTASTQEFLDQVNHGIRGTSVFRGHLGINDSGVANRRGSIPESHLYENIYSSFDDSVDASDFAPTNKTNTRTLGQMSADLLQNINIGKGLAVGALGLAAGIMAAGFIGGNPSHAPQDDAPQLANPSYQNDNYNYDTGMVMAPPQMPQHGYVVNMRASTNGSYGEAQRYIAQATQQSYVANMNLSVRQNFSYSGTKQSNDRYVEDMITRLLG